MCHKRLFLFIAVNAYNIDIADSLYGWEFYVRRRWMFITGFHSPQEIASTWISIAPHWQCPYSQAREFAIGVNDWEKPPPPHKSLVNDGENKKDTRLVIVRMHRNWIEWNSVYVLYWLDVTRIQCNQLSVATSEANAGKAVEWRAVETRR